MLTEEANAMETLYRLLAEQIKNGQPTELAVVIDRSGSVPGKTGAWMAVDASGRRYGTVGGGMVEYRAIEAAKQLAASRRNDCREYRLGDGEGTDLGMVCGGNVEILFFCVDPDHREIIAWIDEAVKAAKSGKPYWLMLPFADGAPLVRDEFPDARGADRYLDREQGYYAERFHGDGRVYVFGGGHLAQELVPLLTHLGFWCAVLDDREEFVSKELFPEAKERHLVDFSALDGILQVHPGDYLVVVTRGHLCDTEAERFALSTDACYIGVVGSRKKCRYVREKLEAEGYSAEQLDRVTAPIGLPIGSETPAEIAVSIAAQLIQVRAEKRRKNK